MKTMNSPVLELKSRLEAAQAETARCAKALADLSARAVAVATRATAEDAVLTASAAMYKAKAAVVVAEFDERIAAIEHERGVGRASLADLDRRAAEVAEKLADGFPGPARRIVAVMATSRRIFLADRSAEKRNSIGDGTLGAREFLADEKFAAGLRLPDLQGGFIWDPSFMLSRLDQVEPLPTGPLGIDALRDGDNSCSLRGRKRASAEMLVDEYKRAAGEIVALLNLERAIMAEIDGASHHKYLRFLGEVETPARRINRTTLAKGFKCRTLGEIVRLPNVAPKSRPIS